MYTFLVKRSHFFSECHYIALLHFHYYSSAIYSIICNCSASFQNSESLKDMLAVVIVLYNVQPRKALCDILLRLFL